VNPYYDEVSSLSCSTCGSLLWWSRLGVGPHGVTCSDPWHGVGAEWRIVCPDGDHGDAIYATRELAQRDLAVVEATGECCEGPHKIQRRALPRPPRWEDA
jgi:hypothetical protein